MIKHLLIILIALTHNCYAQKTISFEEADSLSKAGLGLGILVKLDSTGRIIYQLPLYVETLYKEEIERKFDTVLVVMQMSDTSDYNVDNLGKVYWDFGYEIQETSPVLDFNHVGYLDIDRNPLPQNILIWQSKRF